jgi:hypothetical protein
MLAWFLRLIGLGDDFIDHLDEVRLAFQHPELLWLFGVVLAAGVFIYWWQRRNLGTAPRPLIAGLTLIRVLILAMLITVLAGPYVKIDHKNEKKPIIALLIDQSQSMQLEAGEFTDDAELARLALAAGYPVISGRLDMETRKALNRMSRAKLVHGVVKTSAKSFLEPLAQKYDLRCYAFSRELSPLPLDPAHPELPEQPAQGGGSTYLGDAVAGALNEAAGRPIAGIVLFSDGQDTGGRSVSEVAHAAGEARAPIFSVPVGSSTRIRDVAIVDVYTTGQVAVGDTARVAVTLESQGFDGRPVKVELREGDKLLDSKDLVLRGAEQQQLELTFQATEPGPRYLTVHVPPQPEEPEALRANNTDIAFVRVSEEKIRVLLVEGLPRWDFRFLKNSMRRDHGLAGRLSKEPEILLEAELRRRSPDQNSALPTTVEELSNYHTVILGDASPELLNGRFLGLLDEAVRKHGVGLIVAAGSQSMPHRFDERLRDLLPVRLRSKVAGIESTYKPFRLELSPEGAIHEAMRLYDDPGRNQNIWAAMPPFYWCAAAERAAPAATVLAWNPSIQGSFGKMPLIASQYAGKGQVLFLGTDATFLWRQNVGDRFFYKFWGQSIRSVARRDDAASKKSWMEVRPVRAQVGEQAQIELMAFAADGTPRGEGMFTARVLGTNSVSAVELTADAQTKGRYLGKFTPQKMGEYRVVFDADSSGKAVEARIRVMAAAEELRHPNVNRPTLELLATTSGGKLVDLPDLASIPEQLKGDSKFTELHREATVWDNKITLLVLILLYSLDVGLRRLRGLS